MKFDALVSDLDGVVYRGDAPIPEAAEAITALRERGIKVVFCTNNSRSTPAQYVEKLGAYGLDVAPNEVVTSAVVTAETLQERGASGKRAFVVGGDGIFEALGSIGVAVDAESPADADIVVVGWDPDFTYEKMKRAALSVRSGAELIATNDDAAFPAQDGLWPGAGAILASIEVASGGSAEIMGKPHEPMMDAVARRVAGAERIALVGDRPETDLAGGRARGWTTILVTSGVTSPEDAPNVEPKPDLIVTDLSELLDQ